VKKTLLLGVIALFLAASCTSFQLSGIQVADQAPAYESLGQFSISVSVNEFLGSSGGANHANVTSDAMDAPIYEAIQREIKKLSGDAAINVTIVYKATFVDMLLNGLTGSLYAPAHAEITGTIVKYQN